MAWGRKKDKRGTKPAWDSQSNWTRNKRKDAERQRRRQTKKKRGR